MPWSKHRNRWHSTQFECDLDDARAEAELAAARGRRPTVEVEVVEEDFFGNTTTTRRRTNRFGTTTTTTTTVERRRRPAPPPRPMTDDEAALAIGATAATVAIVALGAIFGGRD